MKAHVAKIELDNIIKGLDWLPHSTPLYVVFTHCSYWKEQGYLCERVRG